MSGLMEEVKSELNPLRKKHKIQVEKRRRTRINNSLTELKTLLLQAMKKENSPEFAKLEKADILDMTVRYLRTIQHQQVSVAMATDPNAINKYAAGFNQCATEVMHYINTTDGDNSELKSRVGDHLTRCISQTAEPKTHQIPSTTPPMQTQRQGNPLRVEIPSQVREMQMAKQSSGSLLMAVPEPASKSVTCVQDSNLESHEGLLTPVTSPVSLKVNNYNEYQGLISHYQSQYSPETTVHRLTSTNDLSSSYSVSPVYRKYPSDLKQYRYSPYGMPTRASPSNSEGGSMWRPW